MILTLTYSSDLTYITYNDFQSIGPIEELIATINRNENRNKIHIHICLLSSTTSNVIVSILKGL